MLVNMLLNNNKGKELKAPHHASTTVPRNNHMTIRNHTWHCPDSFLAGYFIFRFLISS
jgi:hypothetical protein